MSDFPEPFTNKYKIKVELDLPNYATKSHFKSQKIRNRR